MANRISGQKSMMTAFSRIYASFFRGFERLYKSAQKRYNDAMVLLLYLFCILLGYLGGMGFAPYDYKIALFVSLIALIFLMFRKRPPRQSFLIGLFWGFGLHLHTAEWIYSSMQVQAIAPWLSILLCGIGSLYCGVYTGLFTWIANRLNPFYGVFAKTLIFASLWVLLEWLKGSVLQGFPWMTVGYATADTDLVRIVPYFGVYGASFLLMLVVVFFAIWLRHLRRLKAIFSAIAVFLLVALLPQEFAQKTGEVVKVSLVQGNVQQKEKWAAWNFRPSLEKYRSLTEQISSQTQLVVWPESAVANVWSFFPRILKKELNQLAEQKQWTLITGTLHSDSYSRGWTNAVKSIDDRWQYDKRLLVPFSEYTPFESLTTVLMRWWGYEYSNFLTGRAQQEMLQIGASQLSVNICYELAFWQGINMHLPQAGGIINVSNEAWFESTSEQAQFMQMAQLRAKEAGRYIARATNTGITGIINEQGVVLLKLPQAQADVLTADMPMFKGQTPFYIWGNQWIWALLPLLLILLFFGQKRRL